jgi:dipeptidyl aminopeptidase/acylaminoacyl peptidase
MERDIRDSDEAKGVSEFYSMLYAPGAGHVYAARDVSEIPGHRAAILLGSCFEGSLESGPTSKIYRVDLETGEMSEFHAKPSRLPRVSSDGSRIALVAQNEHRSHESILLLSGESLVQEAPELHGLIEDIQWSPNGESLLIVLAGFGADLAGYQGGSVISERIPRSDDWLPAVTHDRDDSLWRRLWLLDVASNTLRLLSAVATNVWEACWLGSSRIAMVRSSHHSEDSWYGAQIATVDIASGVEQEVYRPTDQVARPVGSANGRTLAFIEAICSDRGVVCGSVVLVDTADRTARFADTVGTEVTSLTWRDDLTLNIAGHRGEYTVVADYCIRDCAVTEHWSSNELTCGDWYPAAWPCAGGGSIIVAEAYATAPHIAIARHGQLRLVKSFASPGSQAATERCGSIASIHWTAPDGLDIQGWLVSPTQGTSRAPLVVDLHGGPVFANRNRWLGKLRATPLLVQHGYCVLYPNPRGSSTFGQPFARMVKGDMGGGDARDLMSGIDHLVANGIADPRRIACTGTSYGGYLSAWLICNDQRFAAAVPISPVTDWYSQHWSSQTPIFDRIFLAESPYEPGNQYFTRSPTMLAQRATTPCLVLAGARDKTTPPGQALEFYQALRENDVEACLVTYPNAGHSLRGYPEYFDSAARILIWFERHLARN